MALVLDVIAAVGMKLAPVVNNPMTYDCHVPGNEGISVVALIETSTCQIHTWSYHDATEFHFDLFSCSHFDPVAVIDRLTHALDATAVEYLLVDRAAPNFGRLPL